MEVPLSEIIDVLNERFGTEFTRADQLLFDQWIQEAKEDPAIVERALANALDNFELAMKPTVEALMIDRMEQNQEIVTRYFNDPAFHSATFKALVVKIYQEIRRARGESAAGVTLRWSFPHPPRMRSDVRRVPCWGDSDRAVAPLGGPRGPRLLAATW